MLCVSTWQVMRQQGWRGALPPVLEGQQLAQILLLPQQQSQILAQGRGGCWDSPPISELLDPGTWHPPSLLMGQCPSLFSSPSSPLLPGALCPSGVVAVGHLTPSPSPREVPATPDDTFGWAKGQPHHRGKGLLLSHCKSPWSSTFLMISMPIFTRLYESLGFPSKKENSSKQSPLIVARTTLKTQNENLDTQQRMGWGQWDLAWQWDTHGGRWWWLFPACGLSYSWELHSCHRVNLNLNQSRNKCDSRFLTVTRGPSPNPQILMWSFPLMITA